MLQAIFLDFGNTLVDENRFIPAALRGIVRFVRERAGEAADETTLYERLRLTPGLPPEHPHMREVRGREYDHRLEKFKRFAGSCGCALEEGECREMMRAYDAAAAESDSVIDGTAEALESLAARYQLAVISNGYAGFVHATLQRHGWLRHFQTVLVSQEVNVEKPDRRIFEMAAARLGISLSQAMMVGDNFQCDVAHPKAYGMANCWINPAGLPPPVPEQCDRHVGRLIELARLLG